jgi:hypothetical protein
VGEKDFLPNWFYTLLGKKRNPVIARETTGDDLRDAYMVATNMLERRLYGKWNKKRRLEQLPVVERTKGGSIHLHILVRLDDYKDVKITGMPGDSYSYHMRDIWKRMYVCSKVGNFDSLGRTNFDAACDWSKSVWDRDGVVKYISKQVKEDSGIDACYDLFYPRCK